MEKKKNINYKFGVWTKDTSITKNWTPADYFINNQEVYIEKNDLEPLTPFKTRRVVMIKYVLYGIFDLYKNTGRTSFTQKEIMEQIGIPKLVIHQSKKGPKKNYSYTIKLQYRTLVHQRVSNLIEQVELRKFDRTNNNYDVQDIIRKDQNKSILIINSMDKIGRPDFDLAVNLLRAHFIKVTRGKKDEEYLEQVGPTNKTSPNKFYSLKSEGKKLMEKFQKERFLL